MSYPECIQCGTCCMAAPCGYGEEVPSGPTGECGYLSVDENDNAVCNCQEALDTFIGSGCVIRANDDLYLFHIDEYNIEERRSALHEHKEATSWITEMS